MTLQGLLDTGIIQRKAESTSYGRLVGTPANLVTGWKCRISKDFSMYAKAQRGKGGRESYDIVGEKITGATPRRSDILVIDSVEYEIVEADLERSPYGGHHWKMRVEKIA